MNKIKIMLDVLEGTMLNIGRVGENEHTQIQINCIGIFADYPNAQTSLSVQNPVGEVYPAVVERTGATILWTVTDSDLVNEGSGRIQLTFMDGEEIIKTVIGETSILPSLEPTGDIPTPIENWIDEANEILDEFGQITELSASATTLEPGAQATAEITDVDGHKNIAIGVPKGDQGPQGVQGPKGDQGDPAPVEEVVPAVEDWLTDHITNPSNPPLDRSLTVANAAAPADMVGDINRAAVVDVSIDTPASVDSFSDGADDVPMEVTLGIEPMQSGTGDPSPENIRPIIGRTYLRICNTGKNILGGIDFANAIKTAIPSADINTTTKVVSFSRSASSDYSVIYRGRTTVAYSYPFKENTRYTIILTGYNSTTSTNSTNLRIYYTDGTYDAVPFGSTGATKTTNAIVTDANKTVNYITKINSTGTGYFYYDECGIFEGVLTVQDFEAFKGAYTTITFPDPPGTVYGGTLTVNKDGSGVLTVDKQYITIDENSTIYQSSSDDYKTQFGVYSSGFVFPFIGSTQYATKCDTYNPPTKFRNQSNRLNNDIVAYYGAFSSVSGTNKRWVVWRDDRFNTLSDMEAWIANNNIHVIVELANPVIYTFTASQILSLLGTNNIWVNTGDILSVDYSADTKTYIDQKLSASQKLMELIITSNHENEMNATKAYTTGELLIVDGTLYKATTSIANGATLTVGTNVTATTVAAEIAALS